ncbi:tripartite tricarboxylate transporter TctB family protein [Rhodovibrionaceae bacterium A322]
MALDRWIALILLGLFLAYGYTAWFTMDASLAPFMKRAPVWPSTFPKVLSVLGVCATLVILLGLEKSQEDTGEINYRRLTEYKLGQALLLLGLMIAYALLLRPAGFLMATAGFLLLGSFILGERKVLAMSVIAALATLIIWLLVHQVLGIYLRPLPGFMVDWYA